MGRQFGLITLVCAALAGLARGVTTGAQFEAFFDGTTHELLGTATIPVSADITLSTGLTFIVPAATDLTITGTNQPLIIRPGVAPTTLFMVIAGASLTMTNVDVTAQSVGEGGAVRVSRTARLTLAGVGFLGCSSTMGAGAITNNGVTTISRSTFLNGVANSSAFVYNKALGTLHVSGSSFTGGSAGKDAGAVGNLGAATFQGCTFASNTAAGNGGDVTVSGLSASASFSGCQFRQSSAVSGNGGSLHVSGGSAVAVEGSTFAGTSALVYGGSCFVAGAALDVRNVVFTDCALRNGDKQSQGGAVYLSGAGTGVLTGDNVVVNTTDPNVWTGPALPLTATMGIGHGAGLAAMEGTVANVSGFTCDGLSADKGACLYAFQARVVLAGARVVNNYGFSLDQAAALYIEDACEVDLVDSYFASNRLNPRSEAHQGAAVYVLSSEVRATGCTFFNHSVFGSGGTMYVESKATLSLTNCLATASYASGLGGFLFLSSSTSTMTNVTVTHCRAMLTAAGKGVGQGGAVYATNMYAFFVTACRFSDNEAMSGGALYLNQIKEAVLKPDRPLYFGARIFDTVFERNNATLAGGGVLAKQCVLWAKRSRWTDNVCHAGRGSALDLGFDAIYQLCTIETTREVAHNGTMIEAFRTNLDSCVLSHNEGIGVRMNQDQGTLDTAARIKTKTYPLLSRNTDLSNVRVTSLFANDRWDWMRCKDRSGAREIWRYEYENIPSMVAAGVYFSPACPITAKCTDDLEQRTMVCTCQPGEFHSDVMNEDMGCTDGGNTYAPTHMPTVYVKKYKPLVVLTEGPNATHFLRDSGPILEWQLTGNYPDAQSTQNALLAFLGLVVLMSLAVNVFIFTGATPDAKKDRVLWAMSVAPAVFSCLMCVSRKPWAAEALAWDDAAEEKAFKKLVRQLDGEDEAYERRKVLKKKKRKRLKEAEEAADIANGKGRPAKGKGGKGGEETKEGGEAFGSPLLKKGQLTGMMDQTRSVEDSRLAKRKASRSSGGKGDAEATI